MGGIRDAGKEYLDGGDIWLKLKVASSSAYLSVRRTKMVLELI